MRFLSLLAECYNNMFIQQYLQLFVFFIMCSHQISVSLSQQSASENRYSNKTKQKQQHRNDHYSLNLKILSVPGQAGNVVVAIWHIINVLLAQNSQITQPRKGFSEGFSELISMTVLTFWISRQFSSVKSVKPFFLR